MCHACPLTPPLPASLATLPSLATSTNRWLLPRCGSLLSRSYCPQFVWATKTGGVQPCGLLAALAASTRACPESSTSEGEGAGVAQASAALAQGRRSGGAVAMFPEARVAACCVPCCARARMHRTLICTTYRSFRASLLHHWRHHVPSAPSCAVHVGAALLLSPRARVCRACARTTSACCHRHRPLATWAAPSRTCRRRLAPPCISFVSCTWLAAGAAIPAPYLVVVSRRCCSRPLHDCHTSQPLPGFLFRLCGKVAMSFAACRCCPHCVLAGVRVACGGVVCCLTLFVL